MGGYISNTEADRREMLDFLGIASVGELFKGIPESVRLKKELDLPAALSEMEVMDELSNLASKNLTQYPSFLGAGSYSHFIPSVVKHICSRSEFYTAYTPYQAEASQGTLQAIYEFQSMICSLTGMDVANASMYDGATATAEAVLMACRITKRTKAIIARTLNPETQDVIKTYLNGPEIDIDVSPMNDEGITDTNKLKELITKEV